MARSGQDLVDEAYLRFLRHQQPQQVTFSVITHNICPDFRFRLVDGEDIWFFDQFGMLYMPLWPDVVNPEYCVEDADEFKNISVFLCLAETDPTQVRASEHTGRAGQGRTE